MMTENNISRLTARLFPGMRLSSRQYYYLGIALVFSGYLTVLLTIAYLFNLPFNKINNDYKPGVTALLNGDFIGTKYPPLHVIWCAFRWKLHEITQVSYMLISILLYFPIFCFTYNLTEKLGAYFTRDKALLPYMGLMFIFYPLYTFSIYADVSLIIFIPFLLLSILFLFISLDKKGLSFTGKVAQAAFFLGIASLIRPNPLLIPIVLFVPFLIAKFFTDTLHHINYKQILVLQITFFTVYSATLAPWSYHVSKKESRFVPISTAFIYGHRDGLRRFPPLLTRQTVNPKIQDLKGAFEFHKSMFKHHTGFYIGIWFKKAILCWYGSDSNRWNLLFGFLNAIYLLLGIIGLFYTGINFYTLFLIFYIFYHWSLSILVLSIARYQVPLFVFFSVFAVIGINGLIKKYRSI